LVQVLSGGDRLGPFVLERRIAVGGMAEVWSATREEKRYALKILRDDLARDPQLRTMFTDEVRIAGRLRHPNIVRVEGVWEHQDTLFTAMELLDGKDLRRILAGAVKASAKMPIPLCVVVAREAARALGYAHLARSAEGEPLEIVHRDVSPDNVMVTRSGQVKVLDFGIARAKERLTKTAAGVIKGKISYMAPEQALAAPVSARTDVYALGIVLWEMLAMRRLFHGTDSEVFAQVLEARVPSIQAIRPELPPSLADLVHAMTALRPEQRPESMRAVEDTLSRILFAAFPEKECSAETLAGWAAPYFGKREDRTPAMGIEEEAPKTDPDPPRTEPTSPDAEPRPAAAVRSDELLPGESSKPAGNAPTIALPIEGILALPPEQSTDASARTEAIAIGPIPSAETVGMAPVDALAKTKPYSPERREQLLAPEKSFRSVLREAAQQPKPSLAPNPVPLDGVLSAPIAPAGPPPYELRPMPSPRSKASVEASAKVEAERRRGPLMLAVAGGSLLVACALVLSRSCG
jgi:serine/threonine protein kinase